MNVGRGEGGKWLEVGLGFPPTSQKTKQNKKTDDIERDRFYANQEKLNVDNLKRRKPMQTSIQKKKNKKKIRTHSNKRATEIFVSFS